MKKIILKILKYIGIAILVIAATFFLYYKLHPTFGGTPSESSMEKIKASKNYNGEKFVNLIETKTYTGSEDRRLNFSFIKELLYPMEGKNPSNPLPSKKFVANELENNSFAWFGHSTIIMKLDNYVVITDPVFNNAAPIPNIVEPFGVKKPITIKDLPEKIDVVIISHDHYDHLDYEAIEALNNRVSLFLVPLGVKGHLTEWGVPADKIKEKDWYQSVEFNSITFTMTPARHYSGRRGNDKNKTLWCSWVIKSSKLSVFFNGDSGYFSEFEKIGDKYGPFDISFIENGAYDENWAEIHMFPKQSVQASIDLKSKLMFPIHWGKFDLSNHPWDEPIVKASKQSENKNVTIVSPLIGQIFNLDNIPKIKWWEAVRSNKQIN